MVALADVATSTLDCTGTQSTALQEHHPLGGRRRSTAIVHVEDGGRMVVADCATLAGVFHFAPKQLDSGARPDAKKKKETRKERRPSRHLNRRTASGHQTRTGSLTLPTESDRIRNCTHSGWTFFFTARQSTRCHTVSAADRRRRSLTYAFPPGCPHRSQQASAP